MATYREGSMYNGVPGDGDEMWRISVDAAMTLADDFVGCYGSQLTPPSGSNMVCPVKREGTQIGTITYTTGGSVTWATTGVGAEAFSAGQVLSVHAPASVDADWRNPEWRFVGTYS